MGGKGAVHAGDEMKDLILRHAPLSVQNIAISLYNTWQYWHRRRGVYAERRDYFSRAETLSRAELGFEAASRLRAFLDGATSRSSWFSLYRDRPLHEFPIMTKDDLVQHFDEICTIPAAAGWESHTGGTTGASLKVVYALHDMQERFALLDHFREKFGYTLGKRCAWFSGKSLVTAGDVKKGSLWRDDFINKIRFYSTFHINEDTFEHYWRGLEQFDPEFIVGFPSSISDLCRIACARNLKYAGKVIAVFPTAEMVLPESRVLIEETFSCRIADQYASSEGAPFILECASGSKHIHPLTGVFEVVDERLERANEGEILVTSFTTSGTPLIRYRIGDRIKLAPPETFCPCGSFFPIVERIEGRNLDFIYSPENGRVNQGNLSNCTKNVSGIKSFQLIQRAINEVTVNVAATEEFDGQEEMTLLGDLRERLGDKMTIDIHRMSEIPREASGKFRFVKNHLDPKVLESESSRAQVTSNDRRSNLQGGAQDAGQE
jgi:phenylacetate-CoA ligase